jgi:hypothetical protein
MVLDGEVVVGRAAGGVEWIYADFTIRRGSRNLLPELENSRKGRLTVLDADAPPNDSMRQVQTQEEVLAAMKSWPASSGQAANGEPETGARRHAECNEGRRRKCGAS